MLALCAKITGYIKIYRPFRKILIGGDHMIRMIGDEEGKIIKC